MQSVTLKVVELYWQRQGAICVTLKVVELYWQRQGAVCYTESNGALLAESRHCITARGSQLISSGRTFG